MLLALTCGISGASGIENLIETGMTSYRCDDRWTSFSWSMAVSFVLVTCGHKRSKSIIGPERFLLGVPQLSNSGTYGLGISLQPIECWCWLPFSPSVVKSSSCWLNPFPNLVRWFPTHIIFPFPCWVPISQWSTPIRWISVGGGLRHQQFQWAAGESVGYLPCGHWLHQPRADAAGRDLKRMERHL